MNNECIVCSKKSFEVVWNDKIRSGQKKFTRSKEKILKCKHCGLVFLANKRKFLENSALARNIYNKDNSYKEFIKFHRKRELKKFDSIKNYIEIKNKRILESNCGFGILLNILKKKAKSTAGIDSIHYKNKVESNGHSFYLNIDNALKTKKKYDIIFLFSELEHKFDPKKFMQKIIKLVSNNGLIILRVPNYQNIYQILLGKYFYKYDYRTSHNFYFSKNNLSILLNKIKLKIEKVIGHNEYDFNHLISYIDTRKRVYGTSKKFISNKNLYYIKKNIENNFLSTSLIFILKKK